jgi:hypothetical protein
MADETISYTYVAPIAPGFIPNLRRSVGTSETTTTMIPCELGNMDYQAFLAWVAAGNTAPEGWTGPTGPPP